MFRDLHDDIERIRLEHDIGIAEMEKDFAYKVSLTQSPLALMKTSIQTRHEFPRKNDRHNIMANTPTKLTHSIILLASPLLH